LDRKTRDRISQAQTRARGERGPGEVVEEEEEEEEEEEVDPFDEERRRVCMSLERAWALQVVDCWRSVRYARTRLWRKGGERGRRLAAIMALRI